MQAFRSSRQLSQVANTRTNDQGLFACSELLNAPDACGGNQVAGRVAQAASTTMHAHARSTNQSHEFWSPDSKVAEVVQQSRIAALDVGKVDAMKACSLIENCNGVLV